MTIDVNGPALLQRGGSVVPSQGVNNGSIISTMFTRMQPMHLTVVPACEDQSANGLLFWDDGESVDTIENGEHLLVSYEMKKQGQTSLTLNASIVHASSKGTRDIPYETITIANVGSEPKETSLHCFFEGLANDCPTMKSQYDGETKVLTLSLAIDHQPLLTTHSFSLSVAI